LNKVHYAAHIAALEDKIVQRAVLAVLNAIYEEDFLGFSYGFRPKRGQHDAHSGHYPSCRSLRRTAKNSDVVDGPALRHLSAKLK
jgi:hypothetical protein